ncbi:hypothetical protein F5X97DRAFT_321116 [Nemania serpens]|nr:hypothetical protein F5X97DRAFT_321116 [Nemania serpens]
MTTLRLAIKAAITWLMIQMLYTAHTGLLLIGLPLCCFFGSEDGPCQLSLDFFLFLGTAVTSKHLESLRNPHELTFDAYILLLAALYLIVGDMFRVLLLGACLPYHYFNTDPVKCWAYIAVAMTVPVFPYLRRAYQIFWPSVSASLYNSIMMASSESCTSAVKKIETPQPSPSTPSLPLPFLSFSAVVTMANIEPLENTESTSVDTHSHISSAKYTSNAELMEKPEPIMVDSSVQCDDNLPINPYCSPKMANKSVTAENGIVSVAPKFEIIKHQERSRLSSSTMLASTSRQDPSWMRKKRLQETFRRSARRRSSNSAPSNCPQPSQSAMFTPLSAAVPELPAPSCLDLIDLTQAPQTPPAVCVVDSTPESPPLTPHSPSPIAPTAISPDVSVVPDVAPALAMPEPMPEPTSAPAMVYASPLVPESHVSTVEPASALTPASPIIEADPTHSLIEVSLFASVASSSPMEIPSEALNNDALIQASSIPDLLPLPSPPYSPVLTSTQALDEPEMEVDPYVRPAPVSPPTLSLDSWGLGQLAPIPIDAQYISPTDKMMVDTEGISTSAINDGDVEMEGEVAWVEEPQNFGNFGQYRDNGEIDDEMEGEVTSAGETRNVGACNQSEIDYQMDDGVGFGNIHSMNQGVYSPLYQANLANPGHPYQSEDYASMSDFEMMPNTFATKPDVADFVPFEEEKAQRMAMDMTPDMAHETPKVGMIVTGSEGGSQVMPGPFYPAPPVPATWMSNPAPSFILVDDAHAGGLSDDTDKTHDESDENSKEQRSKESLVREALTEVAVSTAKSWMSSTTSTSQVEKDSSIGEPDTSEYFGVPSTPASAMSVSEGVPASSATLLATRPAILPAPAGSSSSLPAAAHHILIPVKRLPPRPPRPSPINPPVEIEIELDEEAPKLERRFIVSNAPTAPQCNILPQPDRPIRNLDVVPRAKERCGDSAEEYEDGDGYRQKILWEKRGSPPLDEDAVRRLQKSMDDADKEAEERWEKHKEEITFQTVLDMTAKQERDRVWREALQEEQKRSFLRRLQARKSVAVSPFIQKKKKK